MPDGFTVVLSDHAFRRARLNACMCNVCAKWEGTWPELTVEFISALRISSVAFAGSTSSNYNQIAQLSPPGVKAGDHTSHQRDRHAGAPNLALLLTICRKQVQSHIVIR